MPAKKSTKETVAKEQPSSNEEILKRLATIENKIWMKINEDRKRTNSMPDNIMRVQIILIIVTAVTSTTLFKLRDYRDNHIDLMNHVYSMSANVWDILQAQHRIENDLAEIRMQQIKTNTTEYVNCEEINKWKQVICDTKTKDNCHTNWNWDLICNQSE